MEREGKFANTLDVRTLFEVTLTRQATRLNGDSNISDLPVLLASDVTAALQKSLIKKYLRHQIMIAQHLDLLRNLIKSNIVLGIINLS